MNGRLYDPVVGKMLSPDNEVQIPDFTQSYNRYNYCLNNPLKYTDPTGNDFIGDQIHDGNESNYYDPYQNGVSQSSMISSFYRNLGDPSGGLRYDWFNEEYTRNGSVVSTTDAMGSINAMSTPMNWHEKYYRTGTASTYVDSKRNPIDGPPIGAISFGTKVVLDGAQGNGGALEYGIKINEFVGSIGEGLAGMGLSAKAVNMGKSITKYTPIIGYGLGGYQVYNAYKNEGTVGRETIGTAVGVGTGALGGWAGFQTGAWAGFEAGFQIGLAFEGVGAIPGSLIGGFVGGISGAFGGSWAGGELGKDLVTHKW